MTGLLASVRSAAEAALAVTAGADIVDAKEPSAGALGRVDPAILRAIVREVAEAEGNECVCICAQLEADLVALPPEERREYLETLGVKSSACV